MNDVLIECCANSIESALNGQIGGANRIELCQNLEVGGITPKKEDIIKAKETLSISLHVLIRSRGGNFIYTKNEIERMIDDITFCKNMGCEGVVVGALRNDGSIDKEQIKQMVLAAKGMHVTFHRAFDKGDNLSQNLQDVISCGCNTLLTSGQSKNVKNGISNLEELVKLANNKINILAGGGVNDKNIEHLYKIGIRHFHLSGSEKIGYRKLETSSEKIRLVVKKLKDLE